MRKDIMKPLIKTNKYLRNKKQYKKYLKINVKSSSDIEKGKDEDFVSAK
jgi:hypothetical protein